MSGPVLRLESRNCVCCAICVDSCDRVALALRLLAGKGTFPYLAHRDRCCGCLECVRQCPVGVLDIQNANSPPWAMRVE